MTRPILSKEYVAFVLINEKTKIFKENFVTISELNQFTSFMQQEFDRRKLGIVIPHELFVKDFVVVDDVITISDNCSIDLGKIPIEILNVLMDESLILAFLEKMAIKRLEILLNLPKNQMATELYPNNSARVLIKRQ